MYIKSTMIILRMYGGGHFEEPFGISVWDVPIILLIVGLIIVIFILIKRKKPNYESNKKSEAYEYDNHIENFHKDVLMQPKKIINGNDKLPFINFSPKIFLISLFVLILVSLIFGILLMI